MSKYRIERAVTPIGEPIYELVKVGPGECKWKTMAFNPDRAVLKRAKEWLEGDDKGDSKE